MVKPVWRNPPISPLAALPPIILLCKQFNMPIRSATPPPIVSASSRSFGVLICPPNAAIGASQLMLQRS